MGVPNFRGNEDLCKLGKEYLIDLLCKLHPYCLLQHSKTFDISLAFLWVTIAELSTIKQVWFFWPTLYLITMLNDRLIPLAAITRPLQSCLKHPQAVQDFPKMFCNI